MSTTPPHIKQPQYSFMRSKREKRKKREACKIEQKSAEEQANLVTLHQENLLCWMLLSILLFFSSSSSLKNKTPCLTSDQEEK